MPVNAKHPSYDDYYDRWRKCRLCVEGEEAVKAAGSEFLPMLSGQSGAQYDAYRMRASFFGATGRTLEALVGMIWRKEPMISWPEAHLLLLKFITSDYRALEVFAKDVTREVFTTARYGILVDMAPEKPGSVNRPYFSGYKAESILNWKTALLGDRLELVYVALHEFVQVAGEDDYETVFEEQVRLLLLESTETGPSQYKVEIHRPPVAEPANTSTSRRAKKTVKTLDRPWVKVAEFYPTKVGARLNYIPFVVIGTGDLTPDVEKPPLLDLANVNLAHYRNSADHEHGMHFTALPTPWAAGFNSKSGTLPLGSTTAWLSDDPNAKAGFLEFTGTGLAAIREGMKEKQQMMAILGSRLLEEQKLAAEAEQTHRIRKSGENSVVAAVAMTVSRGLVQALEWLQDWANITGPVSVELNKEFFDTAFDSTALTSFMMTMQSGAMSFEVYFYNLQRGGVYPEGWTIQDEAAAIGQGSPMPSLPPADPVVDDEGVR